jgi:starvation-inducible DNA-binding protein
MISEEHKMSKAQTVSTTASDPTVAAAAAQFLSPLVLGLEALTVNGKQAHWHVRGANFVGVHELLDTIVAHAGDFADTAAERIVALGLPIDARISTVAEKAGATSVPAGFTQSDDLIRAVVADIDAILVDVQAAIDGLDEVDLTSQDVAIEIKRGLDKDRWFLVSHIAA